MDVFQYSYLESLDIQAQVIPTRNPSPNWHSSSSSSQPLQVEFLVDFTIHDSASLVSPGTDPLPLLSQRLTTSNALSVVPELYSSWFWARLELNRIGLETHFIEPVITALQAKVHAIVYYFLTRRYGHGQASVKLQVNIKRLTMVPIHHPQWDTALPPLGPLDYDYDYDDDADHGLRPDHDECDEMLAIETLEIVKAEDGEAFIKDASCAVCLEDFRVAVMEEKKVKEVPMKLPCKHVFHEGCIRGWFKKSHFCPLCRSNVLAAS